MNSFLPILMLSAITITAVANPVSIDKYRFNEPLFEGARVVLNALGETFTPEYIQGVSGAAFKFAGGCPSRPTCVYDKSTSDFIKSLGYETTIVSCVDKDGADTTDKMIEAVKKQIDSGKPALVWHAFTEHEWDVVCGYDNETKQFIGRGAYKGHDDYARAPWDRAKRGICGFGAILPGAKTSAFDARGAEIAAITNAIKHARTTRAADKPDWQYDGIEHYKRLAAKYAAPGAARDLADAYCHEVYVSSRGAAPIFLREIAPKYNAEIAGHLRDAAKYFECEAELLTQATPLIGWRSPAGVDEERSKKLAPILTQASEDYEKAIVCLEQIKW